MSRRESEVLCIFPFKNCGLLWAGEGARGDRIGWPGCGVCRLKKRRGGRGFRLRAAECCRDALARLRAAAAAVLSPRHGRARASKETEGDGCGWLAEPTGQAGSPPSDSIPAKLFLLCLCKILP
jgi:hypothetical protein